MMYIFTIILATLFFKDATSYTNRLNSAGKLSNSPDELNERYITGIFGGKNVTIDKVKYIKTHLNNIYSYDAYLSNIKSKNYNDIVNRKGFMLKDDHPVGTVVILRKNWLLTVAYNLYMSLERDSYFIVGSNTFKEGGIKVYPKKFFVHANYTGKWDYDIGLVKLKESLKFSRKIKSVSISSKLPSVGSETIFSGYGYTNETRGGYLQQIKVPYLDYKGCLPHFNVSYLPDFTKHNFCTLKEGGGPCTYDWGGPLVYKKKLIGIFTATYGCGTTRYPPVYTDIIQFKDWISKTIKENSD